MDEVGLYVKSIRGVPIWTFSLPEGDFVIVKVLNTKEAIANSFNISKMGKRDLLVAIAHGRPSSLSLSYCHLHSENTVSSYDMPQFEDMSPEHYKYSPP